jgi:TolB-like protein
MIFGRKTKMGLLIFSSFLLLAACSGKSLKFHRLTNLPDSNVCRLAVLPFTNEIESTEDAVVVYRIFLAELAELDSFELVQEGDIRHAYRQIRMIPFARMPNIEELQILGNYLNVQYMIEGNILDMGKSIEYGSDRQVPFLTFEVRLVEGGSGRTIWTTYHRRKGDEYRKVMHFGVVNTSTNLVSLMSQEILERWASEGLIAQCIE